jgi:diguanylate cyclase (GGDEF)-like protein
MRSRWVVADHTDMQLPRFLGLRWSQRAPRRSLARRLSFVLGVMLCALVVVGAARVVTFSATANALEEFRAKTVGESKRIGKVRFLLARADELGEVFVESGDRAKGITFEQIAQEIDRQFVRLEQAGAARERTLAAAARLRWDLVRPSLEAALLLPARGDGARLDPFHDRINESEGFLGDLSALNVDQVGQEISALRTRERIQLAASFAVLVLGFVIGGLLSRRVYRSITSPLKSLEEAAARLGGEDLSHRVDVHGDDELARVGSAFNVMAEGLQQSREALHHLALHDPLTGLPNRALFMEHLEHAIARSRRKGTPITVMFLDLDGFKAVNDTLGHEAGDQVLASVADGLQRSLREEDMVARLGGDEFGIVLEEATTGAMLSAQRILRRFERPWSLSAGDVPVGVSIGIATRIAEEELDELVRQADTAMYAAKASGKDRWRVFSPDLGSDLPAAQSLRSELQRAVEREEFVVHYQPVMDIQKGSIVGVEALVRWDHPQRGLLPPAAFLEEAEASGHIVHIDRWVLREACRQVRAWQRELAGAENLSVHVNLSARQLQHPGLAEEIGEAVRTSRLAPRDLILEITETTLVQDADVAADELRKLKDLGTRLALDDFGTGFSSLSHLHQFPIDIIKIDRSFVSTIGQGGKQVELVEALVSLGTTLGLTVVAEGVEEVSQLDHLRTIGCEQAQGYYFAKPLAADRLEMLLPQASQGRSLHTAHLEMAAAS